MAHNTVYRHTGYRIYIIYNTEHDIEYRIQTYRIQNIHNKQYRAWHRIQDTDIQDTEYNTEHEKIQNADRIQNIHIIKNRGHDTEHIIQLKRRYEKDGVQKNV